MGQSTGSFSGLLSDGVNTGWGLSEKKRWPFYFVAATIVSTKNPEKTEMALREKLPKEYWIKLNDLLVSFGQGICRPLSPKCSICPIERYCDKTGVTRRR